MHRDDAGPEPLAGLTDSALWRHARMIDAVEDEAERALDLGGFVEGRLDPDDRQRVAERLAADPIAAGDAAAARALSAAAKPEAAPEPVVARAVLLVGGSDPQPGNVIPFAPRRHRARFFGPTLHGTARWGSLVAAMAVASWLGFTLGMDTSLSFAQTRQAGDNGFLYELLDPSTGFVGDLSEGAQT